MKKVKSKRRAGSLRPKDYDHEIDLVDHDASGQGSGMADVSRSSTNAELLQHRPSQSEYGDEADAGDGRQETDSRARIQERPVAESQHEADLPHDALRPSIEIQQPTPDVLQHLGPNVKPKIPRVERETAIDVLYENERGGFLCGVALFSAAALGGLDATAWTNAYHNPSPTSIHTATVPDPSWEWVWSEWRINHQDGMDEGGWEYSFAYSKKFSWHGPKWWSSFVRRRAWIRKRAKRKTEEISADLHMLSTDYFVVGPASTRTKQSNGSLLGSRAPSKGTSMSQVSSATGEHEAVLSEIHDVESLMYHLRKARIDREKLEAVENYLDNAVDLGQMQAYMHDIMGIFVFQASRRLLLGRLMQIYDDLVANTRDEADDGVRDRSQALKEAIKHADEEVRKLAYWSDVKEMAEGGESKGAVAGGKGWDAGAWEGIDQSGPEAPSGGKLPGGKED